MSKVPKETLREWAPLAACRYHDPEIFFPLSAHPPDTHVVEARRICAACPVQRECLDFAVSTGQLGIWAGTTDDERRAIKVNQAKVGAL